MKIWDNGIIRDMTDEEIRNSKETDKLSETTTTTAKDTEKTIIEEFIDRVASANSLNEVKAIAQDIKNRM